LMIWSLPRWGCSLPSSRAWKATGCCTV